MKITEDMLCVGDVYVEGTSKREIIALKNGHVSYTSTISGSYIHEVSVGVFLHERNRDADWEQE